MSDVMDQSVILNKALVELALDLATPSILELFEVEEPTAVWGPKYLVVVVRHPVLKLPVVRGIGETKPWSIDWLTPKKFEEIAHWKAERAQEMGMATSKLTLHYPWEHKPADFFYPGGVVNGNLAVGVSGIKGFADEGEFDVEGDPQSSPWLVKGVRKARQGEEITVEDLRNFDNPSSTI